MTHARGNFNLDYYAKLAEATSPDAHALTGGRWVNDRGIKRWVMGAVIHRSLWTNTGTTPGRTGTIGSQDTTNRSAPEQGAGTPLRGLAGRAKDTTD